MIFILKLVNFKYLIKTTLWFIYNYIMMLLKSDDILYWVISIHKMSWHEFIWTGILHVIFLEKIFSIIKQINGYFWDGAYCTKRYMINNYIKSMLLILHHIINKKKDTWVNIKIICFLSKFTLYNGCNIVYIMVG